MKKLLFAIFMMMGIILPQAISAQDQIPMQIIDPGAAGEGNTLAPPRPWYITQNGYSLTLPALADDYTLELRDEDGVVVYSTYVPAGTTLVVLPSTLSGDFGAQKGQALLRPRWRNASICRYNHDTR